MLYKVRIPDLGHWKDQINCRSACPVHTDARGYIRAIRRGDYERAYLIARGPNPMASICGRVCAAPCEASCRRGVIDSPVSIRPLKRFASERYPTSDASKLLAIIDRLKDVARGLECAGADELGALMPLLREAGAPRGKGEKIAIIGSGPAGLSAAHDLAILGFRPVVFEAEQVAGGMLALGVPEYRLPRAVIQAEIAVIASLGVTFRTGVEVGRDVTLAEIIEGHAAVIIAVGARGSRRLPLKGSDAKGVIGGIEFLRAVSLGIPLEFGRKVIVIGGGNVAFDVSRTAVRQLQSDVARTAIRQPMTEEVHLYCLESRQEMPADDVEVEEGSEEGVQIHTRLGPDEILVGADGSVKAVRFKRVLSVFDAEGRFRPTFDEYDTTVTEGDTVLLAVGQDFDFSFIDGERNGIRMAGPRRIELAENLSTSRPGVFAAGDAALGPKVMIDAVANGKKAARSVYEYLTGATLSAEATSIHFPLPGYSRGAHFERFSRQVPPAAGVRERRRSLRMEVEKEYGEEKAQLEAARCLDCGVNTIFDGTRCILCGGCADVCPECCLKLVRIEDLSGEAGFEDLARNWRTKHGLGGGGGGGAIIKNDERCIRCAACADRCPTGAITMERFHCREVLTWMSKKATTAGR